MSSSDKHFKGLRGYLWPIHRHELKIILPMFVMLFFVCINYTILRNLKDSIVVTASGAEVIPFIKVWVMLPMAIILTLVFTKLSNKFSQENVFYIMISGFLICYGLFAFALYPMRDSFHPYATADSLQAILPAGFRGLIAMFRHWTLTLFYVLCELWSNIVLTVLFWGFANEVTRLAEARRFYSVLSIASNLGTIAAGVLSVFLSQSDAYNPLIPFGKDAWEQTMMILVATVIFFGICTMILFRWMNKNILSSPEYADLHENKTTVKTKKRLSFKESLSYVSKSKYLLCIAVIVIAYNLVINLVEVIWKDQLRNLYPSPSDFNSYINTLTTILGVITCFMAFGMAKLISRIGWTWTALITPIVMAITCLGFFSFIIFQDYAGDIALGFLGTSPLAIAVFFGSAQNCLSKAAKYSVFDATKEMAYIPLSHESRLKGKAAIDGVGSRLGKSGGSLIHQSLLMIFVTLSASTPVVAIFLMTVIIFWMFSIHALGTQFNQLIAEKEQEAEKEQKAETFLVTPTTAKIQVKPILEAS